MIQDVSDQMFGKFTAAMRAELESAGGGSGVGADGTPQPARSEAEPAAPPIDVVSFSAGVVGRAAARGLRRPVFWAAAVLLALLVYLIWLRSR
jgi:hypothetical protein